MPRNARRQYSGLQRKKQKDKVKSNKSVIVLKDGDNGVLKVSLSDDAPKRVITQGVKKGRYVLAHSFPKCGMVTRHVRWKHSGAIIKVPVHIEPTVVQPGSTSGSKGKGKGKKGRK